MRALKFRKLLASIAVVSALGFAAEDGGAAVVLNGCAGGTFGNNCGLDELLAGGSFTIHGAHFSNWTLEVFGRPLDATVIQVLPIDSSTNPGFTLLDTGNTMRAAGGDLTENILSLNATSPFHFTANTLSVQFGEMVNPGEFTFADVSETVFDANFSLIGNKHVFCDTLDCANSTGFDSAEFAGQSPLLAFANVNVGSEATGDVAQINSITLRFQQVTEPGALALVTLGVIGIGFSRRRTRAKSA